MRIKGRIRDPRDFAQVVVTTRGGTPIRLERRGPHRGRAGGGARRRVRGRRARRGHRGPQGLGRQHRADRRRGQADHRGAQPHAARRREAADGHRQLGVDPPLGGRRPEDAARGRPPHRPHRLPVPELVALHGHHRAHPAGLGDLGVPRHLRLRLHAQHDDADGAVAGHRHPHRRRHRGAGEHRAARRARRGPLHRRAPGHPRDRLRGARHHALDHGRVRARWRSWAASSGASSTRSASPWRSPCWCRCSSRSRWTRCCPRAGTTRTPRAASATGRSGRRCERFNERLRAAGRALPRAHPLGARPPRAGGRASPAASFVLALALPILGLVGGQFMPELRQRGDRGRRRDARSARRSPTRRPRRWRSCATCKTRPEVAYCYTTIGGAQHNNSVNKGLIYVKLTPKSERRRSPGSSSSAAIREQLPRFQGVTARILLLGMFGQGGVAPIQLNLQGPNLGELQRLSAQAMAAREGRARPGGAQVHARGAEARVRGGRGPRARRQRRALDRHGRRSRCVRSWPGRRPATGRTRTGSRTTWSSAWRPSTGPRSPTWRASRSPPGRSTRRTGQPVMVPLGQVATLPLRRGAQPDRPPQPRARRHDRGQLPGPAAHRRGARRHDAARRR